MERFDRMDLRAPAAAAPPSPIKDGTEATFMADVIEASMEVPVIVDFWAPWCGPCKTLTPALEKAVTEAKGKVRLVKIDVDQNQRIAAADAGAVDPGGLRLRRRPAGRRLHGRAVARRRSRRSSTG